MEGAECGQGMPGAPGSGAVDTNGRAGPEAEEGRPLYSTPEDERVILETNFMHLNFVVI